MYFSPRIHGVVQQASSGMNNFLMLKLIAYLMRIHNDLGILIYTYTYTPANIYVYIHKYIYTPTYAYTYTNTYRRDITIHID